MANSFFRFKQFTVHQEHSSMKVTTDACLFGAWTAGLLRNSGGRMLDIGAGTGLLSLMIAQQFRGSIEAIEIDELSAAEAASNFSASPWAHRLSVNHIALQQFYPGEKFAAIVSNPPFFVNDLRSPDHRRNIALHGHQLTLSELFGCAAPLLTDNGFFSLLVSFQRNDEVEVLAAKNKLGIVAQVLVRQTPAHKPFRTMYLLRKSESNVEAVRDSIFIRDELGNYSSRFVDLLYDYYLNLKKPPS